MINLNSWLTITFIFTTSLGFDQGIIPDLLNFNFNPKYPVYPADQFLKITSVEMKTSFDGKNVGLIEMISENEIASLLGTNTSECVAVGIYNIDLNEFVPYKSLYLFSPPT